MKKSPICLLLFLTITPALAEPALASVNDGSAEKAATSASVSAPPEEFAEIQQLSNYLHRWSTDEEAIGASRRRDLRTARFHLQGEDYGRVLPDDPLAMDETEDILRSVVWKIFRERLLQTERLSQAHQKLDSRLPDLKPAGSALREESGRRLSISPRLDINHGFFAGARVTLNDDSAWSRWSLHFRQEIGGDEQRLGLQYACDDWYFNLERQFLENEGESVLFTLRHRF